MKFSTFVQAVAIMILFALAASSCRTSRQVPRESTPVATTTKLPPGQAKKVYGDKSAKAYAPGQQKKNGNSRGFPLIIIRTPDIVISKHIDGRYYYQNSAGYYYWKGNDDRFYIDETHLSQVDYNDDQYNDWKNKGNNDKGNNDKKLKGSVNGNNGKNKKG